MPEPISTTVGIVWLGYAALNSYARPGSAISSEAGTLAQAAHAIVAASERSHALFGDKAAAISKLVTMANECAEPGWDGADASAIDPVAVQKAMDFVRAMPAEILLPEFAPEPDGSISLDWISSKHRMFLMSIGRTNRLAFAWVDGGDKGHGVARFDGAIIPSRVLEEIRSVTGHGNAPLRVA